MKAKDLVFTIVVIVLIALTPNSPISVLARDVMADARPAPLAAPIGTGFTYQGQLMEDGQPADGVYDFQFTLYDAETSGDMVGLPVAVDDVVVSGGLFSVELDFGASAFSGEARWLEIGVRPGDSTGSYAALDPRQEITPTPYAIYALDGHTVDGLHASEFALHSHDHLGDSWHGVGDGLRIESDGAALQASSTSSASGVFQNNDPDNTSNVLTSWTDGDGWALEAGSTAATPKAGRFAGNVQITGNLQVDGPAIGFFPQPAWNSGWVGLNTDQMKTLVHGLGGDKNNYVLDFQCRTGDNINNIYIGGDANEIGGLGNIQMGSYFYELTNSSVKVRRTWYDFECPEVRVRIWIIDY